MWQPANIAALPSPADFNNAKKAISELEDALRDALTALEQAQSRVLVLTQELYERKAWIAPIRKLPSELLSEIFTFGSEMEHLAPVTITEVSRLWRAVVLSTPQAWSLIYTNSPEHQKHLVQYVSTFLERSNPCLLHIAIRGDDYDVDSDDSGFDPPADEVLSILRASLSRIQCLSIGSWQLRKLSEDCMLNLVRLTITDLAHKFSCVIPPFFISHDRFPRLQSIQSAGCPWAHSLSLRSLPPLQELAVQTDNRSTWLDVVKNCSTTLKSLTIVGELIWRERVAITLPRLQSLALSDWSDPQEWSISMVTPGLMSYDEFSPPLASFRLLHSDVKSVIYLKSRHLPDLVPFTSLRVLRLSPTYNTTYLACACKLAEQLKRSISTSPALELVEFLFPFSSEEDLELESIKRDVIEKLNGVRPGMKVSFTPRFGPMPGSIEEKSCKSGIPCSQEVV